MNFRTTSGLVIALALAGCDARSNAYAPPPPPEVTVAAPLSSSVAVTYESTGTLRAAARVDVRARVRGFIARRLVEGGGRVEKDAVLFELDRRPFEAAVERARAERAQRQVELRLAELEVGRIDELVRRGTTTQRELDQRVAARDAARAAVELASAGLRLAELDLEWTTVRAPIAGRVDLGPPPEPGELVGATDRPVCTILDDSRVYATYTLDEATLTRLRRQHAGRRPGEDGRPTYPVRLGLIDDAGHPFVGTISHGDSGVSPATGTIKVEAVFDNATGLLMPGLFVRIQAILGRRDALLLPETAVLQDQRGRYVWTVGPDDVVARADVALGPAAGDGLRVIERGLAPDARVVVNGVQRARPGAKVVAKAAP